MRTALVRLRTSTRFGDTEREYQQAFNKVYFKRFGKTKEKLNKSIQWGHSSVGRALEWHSRGREFNSPWLHQINQGLSLQINQGLSLKQLSPFFCVSVQLTCSQIFLHSWAEPIPVLARRAAYAFGINPFRLECGRMW